MQRRNAETKCRDDERDDVSRRLLLGSWRPLLQGIEYLDNPAPYFLVAK